MSNRKVKGFTLIELIIVIVVLGLLSAVALPRFLDLRTDSVLATTEGLIGTIKGASSVVYSISLIEGVEELPSAQVDINGQMVEVVYGYPAATRNGISAAIEFDEGDWNNNQRSSDWHSRASVFSGAWIYWHGTFDENAGSLQCYIRYRQPTAVNTRPTIDFETREC